MQRQWRLFTTQAEVQLLLLLLLLVLCEMLKWFILIEASVQSIRASSLDLTSSEAGISNHIEFNPTEEISFHVKTRLVLCFLLLLFDLCCKQPRI